MSIDTEGWDGLVLRGMPKALKEKRVDVIEFEYMRAWKPIIGERGLQHTLEYMHAFGYACFWQGNKGALAQVPPRPHSPHCPLSPVVQLPRFSVRKPKQTVIPWARPQITATAATRQLTDGRLELDR